MKRAERRRRTDVKIAERERIMRQHGVLDGNNKIRGHHLHKRDIMGYCHNRGCALCAIGRSMKKLEKRRARYAGRRKASGAEAGE
jgi:hypothetical protein